MVGTFPTQKVFIKLWYSMHDICGTSYLRHFYDMFLLRTKDNFHSLVLYLAFSLYLSTTNLIKSYMRYFLWY